MQAIGHIISANRWYFIGFAIILIVTLIPQLVQSQNMLFLEVNNGHTITLDKFFYWLTYLGDGISFIAIILVLLFFSYSKALNGLVIFLASSLVAQLLKNLFFNNYYRPFKALSADNVLHIPDGITPLLNNSFPSGHTVTAFSIATFLVLINPKRIIWLPLLITAWLIGFSRIYLTHHFPVDVWAGAILGTGSTLIVFWLVGSNFDNRFGTKSLLNK